MAKPAAPKAAKKAKDPLARGLAELERGRAPFDPPPPPPSGDGDARILAGWNANSRALEAALGDADDEGRALYARAKAFVDAGMPAGIRDLDEQAALFVASQGPAAPTDFTRRWVAAGGLAYAFDVGLHAGTIRVRYVDAGSTGRAILVRWPRGATGPNQGFDARVLSFLAPEVAALAPSARAELRARLVPIAAELRAETLAYLAIAFDDGDWASEAVRRAEAAGSSFRAPWPPQLIAILRDGEALAHLMAIGGAALQFYAASYLHRARARFSDDVIADALIRFFAAGFAEPRRLLDSPVKYFAILACTIPHPHIAWLFAEHGKHKWLKAYAPMYAESHPAVVPARPSDRALAERMMPSEYVRPEGYSKAELAALDPAARTARLLEAFARGHGGAVLVLSCLADYPDPTVAVALHERITSPSFASQMPKPGLHKELQADLAKLAKLHPAIATALAAAKKAR